MNAAQWLAERREEWLQLNPDRKRYHAKLADFEAFADWLTGCCVTGNAPWRAIVDEPEHGQGVESIAPTGALQANVGAKGTVTHDENMG